MKSEQPILIYLLATLFIGLKLTDQIAWSWWWVLSPLWSYLLLTLVVGFFKGFAPAFRAAYRKARDEKISDG